jgi:hypothetical protein
VRCGELSYSAYVFSKSCCRNVSGSDSARPQ